jgi:hypothetical protein
MDISLKNSISRLYIGKRQADHRPASLKIPKLLIFPYFKPLKQIAPSRVFYRKKHSVMLMFSVLPKRLGQVIRVTSSSDSHCSRHVCPLLAYFILNFPNIRIIFSI